MKKFTKSALSLLLITIISLIPGINWAQSNGFTDDFEDGSLDTTWEGSSFSLWTNSSEENYTLTEQNGLLNIAYNRDSESGGIFSLNLPEPIDASDNPRIKLTVKSSVSFTLDLLPIYLTRPIVSGKIVQEIPGNGESQTYVFTLDDEYFEQQTIKRLNFYFDSEFDGNKSGTVTFDNLSISGAIIEVTDLVATTVDNNSIQLNWNSTDNDGTALYKVYRSTQQGFAANSQTFVTNTGSNSYLSAGLQNNTPYYFRILPVDTLAEEQAISYEIRAETFEEDIKPEISVEDLSSAEFKKYDKVELLVNITDAVFDNPYNPEDIDLRANFISPDDDTLFVYGFYDDYDNRDQWKVRFAGDKVGTWKYEVWATDGSRTGAKATGTFSVVDSDHPGYVQISDKNPNYLEYSDGSFLYPTAVYYPWSVTENGLDRLHQYGVNFFGYWNGTYDGAGNGGGSYLIESLDSGLGRYDQRKSARIDQLLEWAEARDMKMMLAIWAHPFVRDGAPGWDPLDWEPSNPYQEIIDADEFYTDSLAWSYQKKNFRYVVARWGYSPALGIWEIMNEMHGTTAYVASHEAGRDWSDRAHDLLKEMDNYDRPTTVSYGGAEAWNVYNVKTDMPNIHYYEGQGYPQPYGDNVRDGLFNIVDVYNSLKVTKNRPAFLGEGGYTTMFSSVGSDEYTAEFHNAFWAGVSKGIASTPFWWDFTTTQIFTDVRMEQYGYLKDFVQPLNLSSVPVEPAELTVAGSEAYAMAVDTMAFGWFWTHAHPDVSNLDMRLHGLNTNTFTTSWYNTWTGETVKTDIGVSVEGFLDATAPELEEAQKDIAFKVTQIENGTEESKLGLAVKEASLLATDNDSARTVIAYITDEDGRLVLVSDYPVNFTLTGPGSLSESQKLSDSGIAIIRYTPEAGNDAEVTITAEAEGLSSASIVGRMATSNDEDHDVNAPKQFSLNQNYPNPFNPTTTISYSLNTISDVQLEVFDITGRKVSTLVNERKAAGSYEITFDAAGLSSGVYFYKLRAGNFEQVNRMVLLK